MCDGTKQCADGSDESRCCDPGLISSDKFQCIVNGLCIPLTEVCDGWNNCVDGSDETVAACSLIKNVGHVSAAGDKSVKGTLFFTIMFFIIIFIAFLVIIYRCSKKYVKYVSLEFPLLFIILKYECNFD